VRFFLRFAYKGTNYHGWQIQPNAISVQETLNKVISTILRIEINLVGAGRTDTGVHAKEMFAHFNFDGEFDTKDLKYKLNSFLPKDISVYNIFAVAEEDHTRFSAVSRTYEYRVIQYKNPFMINSAYYFHRALDANKMNIAAKLLLGTHNFESFAKSGTQTKTNICTVTEAVWKQKDGELIFTVTADRFLRNMVRALTGTLLKVGVGEWNESDLQRILESKNRSDAGNSVPAHGLYLAKVKYPEGIENKFNRVFDLMDRVNE